MSAGEQTRERIVAAATDAFAARGFDGAATRDIAGAAGVNQGLITYHFDTKRGLWEATVDAAVQRLRDALGARTGDSDEPARVARAVLEGFADAPAALRLLLLVCASGGERLDWLVQRHLHGVVSDGADWLHGHRGALRSAPSEQLIFAWLGAAAMAQFAAPAYAALSGASPGTEAQRDGLAALIVPWLLGAAEDTTDGVPGDWSIAAARRRRGSGAQR